MIQVMDLLGTSTIFDERTLRIPQYGVVLDLLRTTCTVHVVLIPCLYRKDAGIGAYRTVGREPSL
jgi:hypothetical protein